MAQSTRNAGKVWRKADIEELRRLAKGNTPTRVIGLKLGRSAYAIYKRASESGISLAPPNQSPYNRRPHR